MFAVSVQPTPLRWIVKVVPAGPRFTSIGSAVGLIQNAPIFFVGPAWTHRPWVPPRSSGVREAEFDAAGRIGLRFGDHLGNLLPALSGHAVADDAGPVELVGLAGLQAAAAHRTGSPTPAKARGRDELALRAAAGERRVCACCSGGAGSTGGPSVTVKANSKRGRPGAGFCSGLR